MNRIAWLGIVAAACTGSKGGGGPDTATTPTTTEPAPTANGHWTGDCESLVTEEGGTVGLALDFQIVDTDGTLSGTASFVQTYSTDTDTYAGGPFDLTGTRSDDQVSLSFVGQETGSYGVSFEGTLADDELDLTITVAADPPFDGPCVLHR